MKTNALLQKMYDIKHSPFRSTVISCVHSGIDYRLVLLTHDIVQNNDVVDLLSAWRKQSEFWFPQQFPISRERTRNWLEKKVIEEKDRLLFFIEINTAYVGHVGLYRFDIENNMCEIDNIIRGVVGYPGIMQSSIKEMMKWGKKELKLKTYTLETTSDNVSALQLYERLGFTEVKRAPMVYKATEDGGVWEEAPKHYTGKIMRYTVYMKL